MRNKIIIASVVAAHLWLVLCVYFILEEKKIVSRYKIEEMKVLHLKKIEDLEFLLYISLTILGAFYFVKLLQFIDNKNKFDY